MQPPYRPHYASCPSVRLPVRPSVPYGLVTREQKRRKIELIGTDVPQGTSKYSGNFQLKRSEVKVRGHSHKTGVMFYSLLWAADQAQADPAPTAN